MKIREILVERVINAFSINEKEKYAEEVWNMLQISYAPIGGFLTATDISDLLKKSNLWKIILRNGKISAVKIYRDQFGFKSIASATDGTHQGRHDLIMVMGMMLNLGVRGLKYRVRQKKLCFEWAQSQLKLFMQNI
jgi:hypothetical protein